MQKLISLMAAVLLACCATAPPNPIAISGNIGPMTTQNESSNSAIFGFVADSQLQSRNADDNVNWLRGSAQDRMINVTLRPPALDWASRGLLRAYLDRLKERGVKAIFYLGDGANNGCYDEFIAGYDDNTNPLEGEKGILRILQEVRDEKTPIFFIIGNHDFLGAGSTSAQKHQRPLCSRDTTQQAQATLTKWDVMEKVDKFNKQSASIGSWIYNSNIDSETKARCGDPFGQQRRPGCYLAATLTKKNAEGPNLEFLLLDTADFSDVSRSGVGSFELEGSRGAMSFKDRGDILSQTNWYKKNSAQNIDVRIALTHYPVSDLRRLIPKLGSFSKKSQRFMDLFVNGRNEKKQREGYVISAHSHTPHNLVRSTTFSLECGYFPGSCSDVSARVKEINIGSTTDYPTSVMIARLATTGLEFEEIRLDRTDCENTNAAILEAGGWEIVGLDSGDPVNYRDFEPERRGKIYKELDRLSIKNDNLPRCVGLWASELEGMQL